MNLSFHIKNILLLIGYGFLVTFMMSIYILIFFLYFPIYFIYNEIKGYKNGKNVH